MSADIEQQIDSCLAYEVLRRPDEWLGLPSTELLRTFLFGAEMRAACVAPNFPDRRIYGVLNEPDFFGPYVEATGRAPLSITWATALAMTHFSLAAGFAKLRDEALAWHRQRGMSESHFQIAEPSAESIAETNERFWSEFAWRPAMYAGNTTGWALYCFLAGMDRGGDWLKLPPMPRLRELVDRIAAESVRHYGSAFAAFRVYDAPSLLEWGGLTADGPAP